MHLRADAPLSLSEVFVVRFSTDADIDAGLVSGRVEHVDSGRSQRFRDFHELIAFFASSQAAESSSS
jgi:hypothetical protein